MIKNDFIDFPEFRSGFFQLVNNIINHCSGGLFQLQGDKFQTLILVIIFAMQHEKPELMNIGLESMFSLTSYLNQQPQMAQIFYQNFFTKIIRELLQVLTDYRHMSGFKLQGMILSNLIQAVLHPQILGNNEKVLNAADDQPHQMGSNKDFVSGLLNQSLLDMFPNLNHVQVEAFVLKLFNTAYEWKEFKSNLRDLLISMKSFSSKDDAFYEEERQVSHGFNLERLRLKNRKR